MIAFLAFRSVAFYKLSAIGNRVWWINGVEPVPSNGDGPRHGFADGNAQRGDRFDARSRTPDAAIGGLQTTIRLGFELCPVANECSFAYVVRKV